MEPESHREYSPLAGQILYMRDQVQEYGNIISLLDIANYSWQAKPEQIFWALNTAISRIRPQKNVVQDALLLYNRTTSTCEIEHLMYRNEGDCLRSDITSLLSRFHDRTRENAKPNIYDLDFVIIASSRPPQPPGGLPLVA